MFTDECKNNVIESENDPEKQLIIGQYLIEGCQHFPFNIQIGLKYLKKSFKNNFLKVFIYYCQILIEGKNITKNHQKVTKLLNSKMNDNREIYSLIFGKMIKNNSQAK